MKNLISILTSLLNTAQKSVSGLEYVTNSEGKKVYFKDHSSLDKAKAALKALNSAQNEGGVNLDEIRVSSSLLLICLSNMLLAEVNGDDEEYDRVFKSNVMGAGSVEKFIENFLAAHLEILKRCNIDYEDRTSLVIENFEVIDEFVEKDIMVEYSESYSNGEMSFVQLLSETMSFVLEIVVAAHYEGFHNQVSLSHESKEINVLLNMEKEVLALAPLTLLTKNTILEELDHYEALKENKNRLVNRIAHQKYYEMSCLVQK